MEVTLLETGGANSRNGSSASSSRPLQLRVRVGGAEQFCQLQVGQSVLLPRTPSAAWPASPGSGSAQSFLLGGEEQLPAEVTLYELLGSQTLQPPPVGGLLEPDEVLKQSFSIPVQRPAGASQVELRVQRGGSAEEDMSGAAAGSQLTDEARQRDLHMRRLQSLVQDVLRDRPEDPRRYMLEQLRRLQAMSSKHQQHQQKQQQRQVRKHQTWNMTPTPPASALALVGPTGQPLKKRGPSNRNAGAGGKLNGEPQKQLEVEEVSVAPPKATSDSKLAGTLLADAWADADDASANLLRALQPLPRGLPGGKLGESTGAPVVPRPPDSPRKGVRGGRSLMRGIASRIFGSANANAASHAASAAAAAAGAVARGDAEPGGIAASGSAEQPDAAVQGQVQTEARFSLKHILRSAASSAAADQSMREKAQKELSEKLSLAVVRNVRERIASEAADGMARRRGRPPSAARRPTGTSSVVPASYSSTSAAYA
eukprot:TRINITY_DN57988_c0_g1_i1.p1 TRINITY_DN57988_c0_g1~~TRINITY_DN57988_c0_g1_i1.p1  ORF type:complete len:484 (-),score=114.30 TRINITY_DN57988_c0_g1_i1:55-1506(-)